MPDKLAPPPLVILPACRREMDGRVFHATPAAYADALRWAGCQPVMVSAGSPAEFASLLELADGIVLPGSPNNVHPSHFGEEVLDPSLPLDPERDGLSLPLIREALKRGIPLLGICRGNQEFNVALGGSLHQAVHGIAGHDNHQPFVDGPPARKFGPAHEIRIVPGGLLEKILGPGPVTVNSVHGQAVNCPAGGGKSRLGGDLPRLRRCVCDLSETAANRATRMNGGSRDRGPARLWPALALGLLAAAFFSVSFVLNRQMAQADGHWAWSAALRFLMMSPVLALVIILRGQGGRFLEMWRAAPGGWILCGMAACVLLSSASVVAAKASISRIVTPASARAFSTNPRNRRE